jgi:hypothetical protein
MKFYHLTNCNRPLRVGDGVIQFAPYEHTGAWLGVYATAEEKEIALLDKLALDPKSGVTGIAEAQYRKALRIKTSASNSYAPSLAVSSATPGVSEPVGSGEPIDTNPPVPPLEPPVTPLESVSEAVEVVAVQARKKK